MTRSGTKRKNHRRPPISFEPWLCSGCSQVARPALSSPFLPLLAATGFVLRSPPEVAQRLAAELGFARLSPVLRPELFLDGSSFREARSFGPPPGGSPRPPAPLLRSRFYFYFFSSWDDEFSITSSVSSCAQHEGLVSETSPLVFTTLLVFHIKIVLNGKTLNSFTKPKVAVLFWSISCSFRWSRGCTFSGDTKVSDVRLVLDSPLRAVTLTSFCFGLVFFNESVVLICPLATPRLRRSLRRNWWRSASPAGRPTETLLFLIPNSPTLLGQKPSYKRKLANRRSPITFSGYFLSKALPNKRSGRCLRHAAGERVQKKKKFPQVFSAPCKKADAKQSDGLACARGLSHWRLKKRKKKKKANTEKHSRVFSLGSTFRRLWEGVPGVPVSFHGAFSQFCP